MFCMIKTTFFSMQKYILYLPHLKKHKMFGRSHFLIFSDTVKLALTNPEYNGILYKLNFK